MDTGSLTLRQKNHHEFLSTSDIHITLAYLDSSFSLTLLFFYKNT